MRRCFSRATSRSSATVKRSVSRTTASSRSRPDGCTSRRTTFPPRSCTGTRNGPGSYEWRGPDLLKPFLPGLEAALDDPDVSETMINGPGNVWLEGHGRLRRSSGPRSISRGPWAWTRRPHRSSTRAWTTARAWRSASRRPARPSPSPSGGLGNDHFRPSSSAQGALPVHIRDEAERLLHTRRTILVSGGTGSGKTTLLNALIKRVPSQARRLRMARQDKQVPEGAQGTRVATVE